MRHSTKPRLQRGQWVDVEAGFFDVRNLGRRERVVVVSDGDDHVLIEFRRQQHAIPKGRGYVGPAFELRRIDNTSSKEKAALSRLFGSG